jgi:hypothetical protein
VLHLTNQTLLDSYTKKQMIVESATYGSEFMAGRTATGANHGVVYYIAVHGSASQGSYVHVWGQQMAGNSCVMPKARLHKRHVLISFHRIREAVAARILHFIHIPGANNPADVLSKLWGYQSVKTVLKAMLFWQGDT